MHDHMSALAGLAPPGAFPALHQAQTSCTGEGLMARAVQELKAFLTVEGSLADSYQWRQLQPLQGSVLEGIARLPKQLLGGFPPSSTSVMLRLTALQLQIWCNLAYSPLQAPGCKGWAVPDSPALAGCRLCSASLLCWGACIAEALPGAQKSGRPDLHFQDTMCVSVQHWLTMLPDRVR